MVEGGVKIEIIGIKEAINKLKNISEEKSQKIGDAIKKAGFYVQAEVQQSIAGHRVEPRSVDTGRFLNSVKTTFPAPYTASVETNVPYSKNLEYGTSRMRPRHHFTNTVSRETPKVKEFIKEAIE